MLKISGVILVILRTNSLVTGSVTRKCWWQQFLDYYYTCTYVHTLYHRKSQQIWHIFL